MTRERWPKDLIAWRRRRELPPLQPKPISASAWQCGPICVISSLVLAEAPDGKGDAIPQWHVSIASVGRRPKPHHVRKALRAFGIEAAEEDNHEPGNARHFWLPVDPARRVDCECKTTETVITDPDGYRWSNPVDGPCRGCEMAPITRRPCPLHGAHATTAASRSRLL